MRWQDSEWPQAAALIISILADVIDCLPPPLPCLVTESQPLRLRTTCSVPHWPREKFPFQFQTCPALSMFLGIFGMTPLSSSSLGPPPVQAGGDPIPGLSSANNQFVLSSDAGKIPQDCSLSHLDIFLLAASLLFNPTLISHFSFFKEISLARLRSYSIQPPSVRGFN